MLLRARSSRPPSLVLALVLVLGGALAACDPDPVATRQKAEGPTHKIMCSCLCAFEGGGTEEFLISEQTAGSCPTLTNKQCQSAGKRGTLTACERMSVPVSSTLDASIVTDELGEAFRMERGTP